MNDLNWNDFNEEEDSEFSLKDSKPVEPPKACAIDQPDCESCT